MVGLFKRLDFRGIRGFARKLIPLAPAALLLLLFAQGARAQIVNGRVTGDSESEPVRGAVVTLLDADGNALRSVLTTPSTSSCACPTCPTLLPSR
jgi:hypothetical protein